MLPRRAQELFDSNTAAAHELPQPLSLDNVRLFALDHRNEPVLAKAKECSKGLLWEDVIEDDDQGGDVEHRYLKWMRRKGKVVRIDDLVIVYSKPLEQTLKSFVGDEENTETEEQVIDPSRAVEFMRIVGKMKTTPRTGWVLRNVPKVESVADHSYRVALGCFLVKDSGLSWKQSALMALVHDLAEAKTGDIAPGQGIDKAEKHRLEVQGMNEIIATLGGKWTLNAQQIYDLWNNYEQRKTRESQLVKDLDLFDMALQADEYETTFGIDLAEFFQSVQGKIKHPQVQSWLDHLLEQRKTFSRQ